MMARGKNFNGSEPARQVSKTFGGMTGTAVQAIKGRGQQIEGAMGSPAPTPSQPMPAARGGDPTRKVTQSQYDEMLKAQKAKQEAAIRRAGNYRSRKP
jgi:hypothetical protein